MGEKSETGYYLLHWLVKVDQKELLEVPPMGVIGYHPAELPLNRGRHPLIWALVLGLKKTGSTFFAMDEGADSGDIISQKTIHIEDNEKASTLYNKMTNICEEQIIEITDRLKSKIYIRRQQDHKKANYWRKRTAVDGIIDWRMSGTMIDNLIRALSEPYPGASFKYKNIEHKVWRSKFVKLENTNIEPGKVIGEDKMGTYKMCENAVKISDIKPELKLRIGEYL